MLKTIGLVLTVAVGAGAGLYFAAGLKEKRRRMAAVCDFIRNTADGIRLGIKLPRIIELYGGAAGIYTGKGGIRVEGRWLEPPDKAFLEEFLLKAGSGDSATELSRCENCLAVFAKREGELAGIAEERSALYGKLGLLFGIFAAIMLM